LKRRSICSTDSPLLDLILIAMLLPTPVLDSPMKELNLALASAGQDP
jgi:hypothetical protein